MRLPKKKKLLMATVLSAACGLAFNIVADPLVGYLYKQYVLGIPQEISAAFAKIAALTTSVNAVASVIFATILYIALRPVLKKEGFLNWIVRRKYKHIMNLVMCL